MIIYYLGKDGTSHFFSKEETLNLIDQKLSGASVDLTPLQDTINANNQRIDALTNSVLADVQSLKTQNESSTLEISNLKTQNITSNLEILNLKTWADNLTPTDLTPLQSEVEAIKAQISEMSAGGGSDLDTRNIIDIIYKSLLTNKLISFDFEAWKKSFTVIEPLNVGNTITMILRQGGDYGSALAQVKFYDGSGAALKNVVTQKVDEQNKYYIAVFDLVRDEEVIATFRMKTTNYYDYYYKVWHCLALANEEYSTTSHYLLGSTSPVTLTFTLEFLKEGERIPKMTFVPGIASRYSSSITVSRENVNLFNRTGLSYSTFCEVILTITPQEIQAEIDAKYAACMI
ncbi:hypothetical protein [Campylobacter fetus]|uniref:hypothetical protein n=1 Tax=Campylobacter fetus TaxID=196 RepID=UPI0013D6C6EB|nr:hypothetical protein [Campylobacter fetus]